MFCNHIQTHVQNTDNFFDRVQGVFRVGEGTGLIAGPTGSSA